MPQAKLANNPPDLSKEIQSVFERRLTFLLAGRTGVGKSSAINSLLGKQVAPTDPYQPTTFDVQTYAAEVNGIRCNVIDTPGLCDDLEDAGNDEQYLDLIRSSLKEIDCLWYVTRLDETRVSADEKRSIRLISTGLGTGIWEHAVLVFTFANSLPTDRMREALSVRTNLLRQEVGKYGAGERASQIPSVAIDNSSLILSDRSLWLPELFTTTVERIREGGIAPFLFATSERVGNKNDSSRDSADIPLNDEQTERVRRAAEKEPGFLSRILGWIKEIATKENLHTTADVIELTGDVVDHPKIKVGALITAKLIRFFAQLRG